MYSPRLYDGDLMDYCALPIALDGEELLRYSGDPRLPLKSTEYLNFLSRPYYSTILKVLDRPYIYTLLIFFILFI